MAESYVVKLKWNEMVLAAVAGVLRQVENVCRRRKPEHGAGDASDWQLHIQGCLGEMALAKWLGVYWSGAFAFRDQDVGRWQVRCSVVDKARLIVHKKDADGDRFVLVTGRNNVFTIRGWMPGREAKQECYWAELQPGRPAYCVPQEKLQPLRRDCG